MQDVEAAIYFCVLEALQNAQKYAGATAVTVRLNEVRLEVRFEVEDNGIGLDPAAVTKGSGLQNMEDRLEALGGRLRVDVRPGEGALLLGQVPVPSREGVA